MNFQYIIRLSVIWISSGSGDLSLVLVQVYVLVLDLSSPTSLWFGLGAFLYQTRSMYSICCVVFVYFI